MQLATVATTFALVFVGELPDKTAIAGLVLGTRYRWWWAFAGIAAAFLTHVVIAVTAGSLLGLLPERVLQVVVGLVFLAGAVLVWREGNEDEDDEEDEEEAAVTAAEGGAAAIGFWKVAALSYGVIFLAEWGDITQILTANLAARYRDPLSVGLGATLGLWGVGLLSVVGGKALLRVLPMTWIARTAALVMTVLGVVDLVRAARG
ncbi:TMEM165/GDT1 family protein [Lapillicoccus jejuensis]|uniref:TMEM165/GDT1 family protein n=1 Tax=Lapillicoccus jejuensis TaxID=402171 RepID=UPI0011523EC3|nr:TMEM165/GDT1 family protein [Lapillicoccus jejuensis]